MPDKIEDHVDLDTDQDTDPENLDGDQDGGGGEDSVTMSKAEHDALQANARLFKKQERERKKAEAEQRKELERKKAQKAQKAADDAGLGLELREAQAEARAAKAEAQALRAERAVDLALTSRNWADDTRELAIGQLDTASMETGEDGLPTEEAINSALDDLEERYPSIFTATTQRGGDGNKEPDVTNKGTKRTPANPLDSGRAGQKHFEGYVSPSDFMRMTQEERQDPDTWARIEKSMVHWDIYQKPFEVARLR